MRPTHEPPEKGILIGKPWGFVRGWEDFDRFYTNPFRKDDPQYQQWQDGNAARNQKESKGDEAVYYKFVDDTE